MAEDTKRSAGPYLLLRRCDEVEPMLGVLYESWNVLTNRPALTLFPRDSVQWQPTGPRRAWIDFNARGDAVSLELERQPDPERTMEWVNLVTLLELVGRRVEDSLRLKAHRSSRSPSFLVRGLAFTRWAVCSPGGWTVTVLTVLALGVGVGLGRQPSLVPPDAIVYGLSTTRLAKHWVELEKRPPCFESQVEHEGKCYVPVEKWSSRLPQSVEP